MIVAPNGRISKSYISLLFHTDGVADARLYPAQMPLARRDLKSTGKRTLGDGLAPFRFPRHALRGDTGRCGR
jgi:hypothetical protein